MQCAYHPDREPFGACVSCGRLICVECTALLGGRLYCSPCADRIFVQGRLEPTKAARAEPGIQQQPATVVQPASGTPEVVKRVEPQTKISKPEPSAPAINNSGQGSASSIPSELKGWSWGAFALTWIWGIGNRVWIAFLVLGLSFIWAIVLGIKGREWAWQSGKWDSVEQFRKTQSAWDKWGKVLFIAGIIIGVIYVIFMIVAVAAGIGEVTYGWPFLG